jgi:cell division protein FtsW (lipid II flippase)
MTDQSVPQFIDEDYPARQVRGGSRAADQWPTRPRPGVERKLRVWNKLDKALLIITGLLLLMGSVMVFSATFDWSLLEYGSNTAVLINHLRNVAIGLVAMLIFSRLDTRLMRRLAIVIMLMAISFLISVLMFGDRTFGARRALINGRFQPGEFSELAMIIYMAAWLGSKHMRVRSFAYGLVPFVTLVMIVAGLVVAQPDLSTAVVILITTGVMYFLAGADMRQIMLAAVIVLVMGVMVAAMDLLPSYAAERVGPIWRVLPTLHRPAIIPSRRLSRCIMVVGRLVWARAKVSFCLAPAYRQHLRRDWRG